jgi:hypothetical protein
MEFIQKECEKQGWCPVAIMTALQNIWAEENKEDPLSMSDMTDLLMKISPALRKKGKNLVILGIRPRGFKPPAYSYMWGFTTAYYKGKWQKKLDNYCGFCLSSGELRRFKEIHDHGSSKGCDLSCSK